MPLVLADRVRETTTTTGTGTISLAGPVSGFQGFSTAIGNANTTYYTIVDAATGAWEVGLGTYTSSGSTLARTTVLSSSNSDALVPFASGVKDVFVTQPAERAVYVLGAGTGLAAGAAAFTANGVPYASATNTLTTGSALTFDGTTLATTGLVSATGGAFNGNINPASGSSVEITYVSGVGYITSYNRTSSAWTDLYFRAGANTIWSASGTEQMRLTSTGLGIGTSSPGYKLSVNGSSSGVVANIGYNGDSGTGLYVGVNHSSDLVQLYATGTANKSMAFYTGATEVMRYDSSGNLGIGTSSPAYRLVVSNSGADGLEIGPGYSSGKVLFQAYNRSGAAYSQLDSSALLYTWFTPGGEKMRLDSSGNLGLGVTPSAYAGADTKAIDVNSQFGVFNNTTGNGTMGLLFNAYYSSGNYRSKVGGAFTGTYEYSAGSGVHTWKTSGLSGGGAGTIISLTQAMTLDASGNLGVGTTSMLGVSDRLAVVGGNIAVQRTSGITTILGDNTQRGYVGTISNHTLSFLTNSTEQMRLDTSGNLGLGVTPSAWGSTFRAFQVARSSFWTPASGGSTYIDTNAFYDSVGYKYIANGFATEYAQVTDGSHRWYTAPSGTAGNAISFTQAMTLDASGNLQIGNTSYAYRVAASRASDGIVGYFRRDGATVNPALTISCNETGNTVGFGTDYAGATSPAMTFSTQGSERARITSGGDLLVGTTSNTNSSKIFVLATSTNPAFASQGATGDVANPSAIFGKFDNDTTTSQIFVRFTVNNNSAGSGQITANGANTAAFGSYSDQRLKENIVDLPPQLANIMALRPVEFDYIQSEGGGHQIGFIAQNMEEVYPDVVGEREDGMKMIAGWSKTEARLVKAIQELKAEVDSLKAQIKGA